MIMRKILSSFMARIVLVVMLASAVNVSVAPTPVYAGEAAAAVNNQTVMQKLAWLKEFSFLADIITALTSVANTITTWMGQLIDKMGIYTAIQQATEWLKMQLDEKMHDDAVTVAWQIPQIDEAGRIAKDNLVNPAAITAMCRTDRAHQIRRNLEAHGGTLTESMARGLDDYPDLLRDGAGPAWSADINYARNKAQEAQAQFPEEKDLDISAEILRADISKTPFQMPPTKPRTVNGKKVQVTDYDLSDKNQRYFLYAMNYCYNLVGPVPSPPTDQDGKTLAGLGAKAQYMHCRSLRSTLSSQCVARVIYLARPNCTATKEGCEQAKKQCSDALSYGDLPPSFENCSKPISLYQSDYLINTACMGSARNMILTGAGFKPGDTIKASDDCLQTYNSWRAVLAQQETNLINSSMGVQILKACFKN